MKENVKTPSSFLYNPMIKGHYKNTLSLDIHKMRKNKLHGCWGSLERPYGASGCLRDGILFECDSDNWCTVTIGPSPSAKWTMPTNSTRPEPTKGEEFIFWENGYFFIKNEEIKEKVFNVYLILMAEIKELNEIQLINNKAKIKEENFKKNAIIEQLYRNWK